MQRCEEILERSPDYTDALNLAGQIAWARRDAKAAEKYYSKALKVDPLFLDAQLNSDAMIWG
jgi:Tfp pilus assembly protein PilF